ncbi:hypothetical protein EYC80_001011 [Monilinia laxa]|uniref:Ubiquitin-like domain-containing protein n=1 Tax=Monilinia laxa TaxID=61186 RepID=A0A5N6K7X7_MONLA|nr:hypothetical protein EYC80_001011 [Monilinia laxa]
MRSEKYANGTRPSIEPTSKPRHYLLIRISFGFSAGDSIAAGEIIATLIKGLRETGGSNSDYQELVRELHDPDKALKHVDSLKAGNKNNLDIIKCAASSCRNPLEQFLKRISRYEYSLGPAASSGIKVAERKIRWIFAEKNEIQKLSGYLSTHVASINTMLASHGLETLNLVMEQAERHHLSLKSAIVDAQNDIANRKTPMKAIEDNIRHQSLLVKRNWSILATLSWVVNDQVVLSLKYIKEGVVQSLLSLQQVLKLVQELRVIAPAVDTRFTYFQAPVKVEDALGRVFPVPSDYSFGDLRALIQHRFKVGPGHSQVSNGNYEIFNSKNRKQIVSEEYCNILGLSPGSMLTMAIIVDEIVKTQDNTCPMPRCGSHNTSPLMGGGMTCNECGVWFDGHTSQTGQIPSIQDESTEFPVIDLAIPQYHIFSEMIEPKRHGSDYVHNIEDLMAFKNIKIGELVRLRGKGKGIYYCPSSTCKGVTGLAPGEDTIIRFCIDSKDSTIHISHKSIRRRKDCTQEGIVDSSIDVAE